MGYEAFVERVEQLGGFDRREDAERAIGAVLEVLGERLVDSEAYALARALPGRAGVSLRRRHYDRAFEQAELVARVAARENVAPGFALEHTQAVLGAVGQTIGAEARLRLKKALTPSVAALFEAREIPDVELVERERAPAQGASTRTLATGRPGSRHRISEAAADRAHADSVASSDNPHADTKLSSSPGMTQERLAETLAKGRSRVTK